MLIIDKEFKELIQPLSKTEYTELEQSILNEGCRDPLVMWGYILIDGHNRYQICSEHNIPYTTVNRDFATRDDAVIWIIRNQIGRRNLITYARVKLALRMKPLLAEKAKERQGTRNDLRNIPQKSAGSETRDEIASAAGVSHDTISKVIKIEEKASDEMKEQLMTGDMSINEAYKIIKRREKEDKRETKRLENEDKVKQLNNPLEAQGLFQTIVIDPPWDWGDEGDCDQFGRAKPDYHTMPIEDIKALPVNEIADENCHLYLWVTNRSLPKAFDLIEAWGFRYITCITWVKPNIGMGNYFRGSTEQILFAVKGSQLLKRKDVGTYFEAPRGEGHSAKPDEFYALAESCSYAPYIDIFGRKERDGWTVWGENG